MSTQQLLVGEYVKVHSLDPENPGSIYGRVVEIRSFKEKRYIIRTAHCLLKGAYFDFELQRIPAHRYHGPEIRITPPTSDDMKLHLHNAITRSQLYLQENTSSNREASIFAGASHEMDKDDQQEANINESKQVSNSDDYKEGSKDLGPDHEEQTEDGESNEERSEDGESDEEEAQADNNVKLEDQEDLTIGERYDRTGAARPPSPTLTEVEEDRETTNGEVRTDNVLTPTHPLAHHRRKEADHADTRDTKLV
ncbi:hypothetical protein BJ508DRAFT_312024, partial [Ascobolus immersus RN42]